MAKIAIDAGHGLKTAGKRCLKSLDKNETREWVLNNRVSVALEEYLESAGHTVLRVDDRDGSTDVTLATRVGRANDWDADYFVSIHHNAGINGGSGGGTIVFVYPGTSGKTVEAQQAIYKHTIKRGNLKGNRYDGTATADFYVTGQTTMPASLVECGFMDSSTDIKYILDPAWSRKIALGIAEGICEVFGGTVKVKGATVETADSFDKAFKGRYVTTVELNLRIDAGVENQSITVMPKSAEVQCYGYYSKDSEGTTWLYVVYDDLVGFAAKSHLKVDE